MQAQQEIQGQRVKIPLDQLTVSFYVRKGQDEDRVQQFGLMFIDGADLGPLIVNSHNEIIDGRHRFAALKAIEATEADCEIRQYVNHTEEMVAAFAANLGGAMPPTTEDFHFVINKLMDLGLKRIAIQHRFPMIPKGVLRKYFDDVQSKRNHASMGKARLAVSEGKMKVEEAAAEYGVDVDRLKALLSGAKRNNAAGSRDLHDIKVELSKRHKALSGFIKKMIEVQMAKYEDGETTAETIEEIFSQIERARKRSGHMIDDLVSRFRALRDGEVIEGASEQAAK